MDKKKLQSHIGLLFFDFAALFGLYCFYSDWSQVNQQISVVSESITVHSPFSISLAGMMILFAHILSIFKWDGVLQKWGNAIVISFFLSLVFIIVISDLHLRTKLSVAGYNYCDVQSKWVKPLKFNTYLLDDVPCVESTPH